MHNPESVQENVMQEIIRCSKQQTDHLISAKRPDLVIVNNKKVNLPKSKLCRSGRPQSRIKNKTKSR